MPDNTPQASVHVATIKGGKREQKGVEPDNTPQAFVHVATDLRIARDKDIYHTWTYIDSVLTNNKPDALVFVTQRWGKDGKKGKYNDHPVGVWYDDHKGKWSIYNQRDEDSKLNQKVEQAMSPEAAFNVWVYPDASSNKVSKTNNNQDATINVTPNVNETPKLKSRLFKALFYIVLSLLVIWLTIGIILYLQQNLNAAHWQNMFMLRDNPLASIALLLIVVIILSMFFGQYWGKLFAWFGRLDPLNQPMQATILLSVMFFATLLAMTLLFPDMTGYSFKSDWSLLLVATIPLLALIVLILINKYSSLRLEGVGLKVEFTGGITTWDTLDIPLENDSIVAILRDMKAGVTSTEARILLLQIEGKMSLEFTELQEHISEISTMAPIRYIVFVNGTNHYLGFITMEKFKSLLPVPNLQQITEWNLKQLEVSKQSLKKPTVFEAYRRMVQNNLPGIPVIDEGSHFEGVMEKDKIEQAVVMQLLEKSAKQP